MMALLWVIDFPRSCCSCCCGSWLLLLEMLRVLLPHIPELARRSMRHPRRLHCHASATDPLGVWPAFVGFLSL